MLGVTAYRTSGPTEMTPSSLVATELGWITRWYAKFSCGRNRSPRYFKANPAFHEMLSSGSSTPSKGREKANPVVGSKRTGPACTLKVADGATRQVQTGSTLMSE